MQPLIIIIGAFITLHWSTGILLSTSEKFSEKLKLPTWFVSGLLLSIGTSIPEGVVSITSSLAGYQKMAVGNIIGSNMANIGLALSLPWIWYSLGKIDIPRLFIVKFLVIQVIFCAVLIFYKINVTTGCLLLGLYIASLMYQFTNLEKLENDENQCGAWDVVFFIFSLILVPASSFFIVQAAGDLMSLYGIDELFFGIIIIAIGTSIPEIYTTFFAFRRQKYNLALMNVIGSNILNSTAIVAFIGFLGGYQIQESREAYDLLFMLFLAILVSFALLIRKTYRLIAVVLLGFYLVYLFSWA